MGTELTPTGIEYLVMSIVYIIVMIVTVFDLVILFLNSIAPITDDGGRSGSQRKHKHVFVIRLHVVFRLFLLISLGARVVMMLLRVAWDPSGKSVADVALSRTTTTFSFTAFAMVVLTWDNITRLANTRQTPVLRVIVVGAILFFQLVEWVFFIIWLWSDRTKDGNILFDIPVIGIIFAFAFFAVFYIIYGMRLYWKIKKSLSSVRLRRMSISTVVVTWVCCICFLVRAAFWAYRPLTGKYMQQEMYNFFSYFVPEVIPSFVLLFVMRGKIQVPVVQPQKMQSMSIRNSRSGSAAAATAAYTTVPKPAATASSAPSSASIGIRAPPAAAMAPDHGTDEDFDREIELTIALEHMGHTAGPFAASCPAAGPSWTGAYDALAGHREREVPAPGSSVPADNAMTNVAVQLRQANTGGGCSGR